MKQYLDIIKQIFTHELTGTIETFEHLTSKVQMNQSATKEKVVECNNYFNGLLPEEYKDFLMKYNGGFLFQIEDFAGFKFLGTNELLKENSFQRENFGEDWNESIILFCLCIGDGEYLGFKLNNSSNYQIVHCIMDELPEQWKVVDNSFDEFISRLLSEKGRKYWL